jgi:transketolase
LAAYGVAVARALEAARRLATEGIEADVLDMRTLKPMDTTLLLDSVRTTGALVSVEDHNIHGGLGSAMARALLEAGVAPAFRSLGIADTFTESAATPGEIRVKSGVGTDDVVQAARSLVAQRRDAAGVGT